MTQRERDYFLGLWVDVLSHIENSRTRMNWAVAVAKATGDCYNCILYMIENARREGVEHAKP